MANHTQDNLSELKLRPPLKTRIKKQKYLLLMLLPGLVYYAIFKYIPLLGLGLSFTDYGFRAKISFVGLDNFRRLLSSSIFWNAFKNTMIISLANIVFYFPAPIIVALLVNELKSTKAKRLIQFLIYIPYFFSWVVVGSIFVNLLSPSSGLINNIITKFGGKPVYFMASAHHFRSILVSSYIWRQMGYGAVIYIAALTTIPPELYEAATIDGAGHWGKLLYVTLPSIRTTIVTMLLLNLSHVLMIFEQVLVMYNAAVYDVADVLQTYVFREGLLAGDIGYSIAVGMFTSLISLVLVMSTNKASSKFLDEPIL
ncbi:ABC-type polysaccharide transport system, permease component [Sphaerochaeta pleomorpha str. Grapes]|uniref:ABC-type polysaccharide transport system, permease component n=1 Tax=Sphaerochaeta pleomorpha (strain ATCC BAA-1885 / DSM 22778 / Grapes) TaxID=158190 RepID=G8QWZ2_SPHPG|nr:ABC transporter permease subunit [Sphaerochaeta pleomorpha]AEV29496.1 ABC-type polysaccharide transport system, permease component [Sphaerochaeta pleomorpha str. Grapes]